MSGPTPTGGLLGQLAVARGLVTPEQLRACLEIASRAGAGKPLGAVLVSEGLVSPQQLQALLEEQQAMPRPAPLGPKRKTKTGAKSAVDLSLSDDEDTGAFEIESSGESRLVGDHTPAPATKAPSHHSAEAEIDLDAGPAPRQEPPPQPARPRAPPVAPPSMPTPAVATPAPAPASLAPAQPAVPQSPGAKHLHDLVGLALRAFASDLHLHPGFPVAIRQHGKLVPGQGPALVAATLESALREILSPAERAQLDSTGETEAMFLVSGGQRCRVHAFREAAGISATFRVVPVAPPSLAQLGLPNALARFVTGQGLVLVAGPRGCGKTWTLAALVDLLNGERQDHIVCIERPIEFVHSSKRCVVTQRAVPTHAASVERGVRAALHEDPDVLVVGEIEDVETARLAMQAAEGGRLVLATFSAQSAVRAIARIIGLFPADQQVMAGAMLAGALRASIGQRLVISSDGNRRVPICEWVDVDGAAADLLAQGRVIDVKPSVSVDQALSAAVRAGAITRDEARTHAERTEAF